MLIIIISTVIKKLRAQQIKIGDGEEIRVSFGAA